MRTLICLTCWAGLAFVSTALAQAPATPAPPPLPTIDALAWLEGCWAGKVNQRDFREQWSPLRGGMLLGLGHTVREGSTQDFEYLRLETRGDGVYYIALPSGQKESAFRLTEVVVNEKDQTYTFTNPDHEFPQRISYRRGADGWLYATIDGKLKGEDRKVVYPYRKVDCATGAMVDK